MTGFFEDHLNLDTIVAFVDGELSMTAYQRAAAHLVRCPMCGGEVAEQSYARQALRTAPAPRMPGSLAAVLCSIPIAMPTGASDPGVAADSLTGHAIRVSHVGRDSGRGRRFRLGAGALVAGIAVGALATAGSATPDDPARLPTDLARTVQPAGATGGARTTSEPVMMLVPVATTVVRTSVR